MEYLEGKALQAARSATHGGMPLPSQLRVLSDVLAALDYAHELRDFDGTALRVVHRDVSPQNVFITYPRARSSSSDFSIAKAVDSLAADADRRRQRQGHVHGARAGARPAPSIGAPTSSPSRNPPLEAVVGRRMWKVHPRHHDRPRALERAGSPRLRSAAPDVAAELERINRARARATMHEERFTSAFRGFATRLRPSSQTLPERPTARDIGASLSSARPSRRIGPRPFGRRAAARQHPLVRRQPAGHLVGAPFGRDARHGRPTQTLHVPMRPDTERHWPRAPAPPLTAPARLPAPRRRTGRGGCRCSRSPSSAAPPGLRRRPSAPAGRCC